MLTGSLDYVNCEDVQGAHRMLAEIIISLLVSIDVILFDGEYRASVAYKSSRNSSGVSGQCSWRNSTSIDLHGGRSVEEASAIGGRNGGV